MVFFRFFLMALYRWGEDLTPLPRPATELHIPVPPRGSVLDLIFTEDQGKARVPCALIVYHLSIIISKSLLSSSRNWWNVFYNIYLIPCYDQHKIFWLFNFFTSFILLLLVIPHIGNFNTNDWMFWWMGENDLIWS